MTCFLKLDAGKDVFFLALVMSVWIWLCSRLGCHRAGDVRLEHFSSQAADRWAALLLAGLLLVKGP